MESSSAATESWLSMLRSDMAASPETAAPQEEWTPEPEVKAPPRSEVLKEQLAKMTPLPGRFARFTAKNRPAQIVLIVLGIGLLLFLFLILWFHLIPVKPLATLITGPAKKYIPQTALPAAPGAAPGKPVSKRRLTRPKQ